MQVSLLLKQTIFSKQDRNFSIISYIKAAAVYFGGHLGASKQAESTTFTIITTKVVIVIVQANIYLFTHLASTD